MNPYLQRVDFAALRTLRVVYRRRSFTEAADELEVNQSTISYTIGRLRKAFSDPLFVRQGGGIAATERCEEILKAIDQILSEVERAATPAEFNPAEASVSVTISATYLARSVVMPRLVREVRQEAPGITVELITGFTDAKNHLLSGRADLALTPVSIEENGIYGQSVFKDPYACLMDKQNPLATAKLSLRDFASAKHLIIHYGAAWKPLYLGMLERKGMQVDVALSTPDPADVEHLIPGTDLVVALPGQIARQFSEHLYICPCPVPAVAEIRMYWPARLNRSPLNNWLRGKIERIAVDASASDH